MSLKSYSFKLTYHNDDDWRYVGWDDVITIKPTNTVISGNCLGVDKAFERVEVEFNVFGDLIYVSYTPEEHPHYFNNNNTNFKIDIRDAVEGLDYEPMYAGCYADVVDYIPPREVRVNLEPDGWHHEYESDEVKLMTDDILTIYSDEGKAFDVVNILSLSSWGSVKEFSFQPDTDPEYFEDDSFNALIGEFEYEGVEEMNSLTVRCNMIDVDPPTSSETLDIVNLHVFDRYDMVMFDKIKWGADGVTGYSDYIHDSFMLPFKIPDHCLKDELVDVKVGKINVGFKSPVLKDDKIIVDAGQIEVLPKYGNVYDYKNVTCRLYAPYIEYVDISVHYVMGRVINVKYVIDVLNNICVLYIIDDRNHVILREDVNITRAIPYTRYVDRRDNKDVGRYVLNTTDRVVIEVVRDKPAGRVGCVTGKPVRECGVLSDYEGYVRVEDYIINCDATNGEKDDIKRMLLDGVYIK